MTVAVSAALVRAYVLGTPVNRAAAVLPATAQSALFTITGGRVEIVRFIGECTTVCSGTATNLKFVANPTTGTDVDVCANGAVTSKEVGTLIGVTGLFSDALNVANAGALSGQSRPFVVPIGTLDWSTSATNTGAFKFKIWWRALDDGALLVAA